MVKIIYDTQEEKKKIMGVIKDSLKCQVVAAKCSGNSCNDCIDMNIKTEKSHKAE